MKKFTTLLFLSVFFVASTMPAQAARVEDGEDQWNWWNTIHLVQGVDKGKANWRLASEQRFRDNVNLYRWFASLGYHIPINDWFGLHLRYRYQQTNRNSADVAADWRDEHRPDLGLYFMWNWGFYNMEIRDIVEGRILQSGDDIVRNRLRAMVAREFSSGKFDFKMKLSNEIFYEFRSSGFTENRTLLGASTMIGNAFELGISGGMVFFLDDPTGSTAVVATDWTVKF